MYMVNEHGTYNPVNKTSQLYSKSRKTPTLDWLIYMQAFNGRSKIANSTADLNLNTVLGFLVPTLSTFSNLLY